MFEAVNDGEAGIQAFLIVGGLLFFGFGLFSDAARIDAIGELVSGIVGLASGVLK